MHLGAGHAHANILQCVSKILQCVWRFVMSPLPASKAGWRADLRFLTGPEGEPAEDFRQRGGQDEQLPSSEMGYHFVTMDFEDRSGQGTGAMQKRAAGSAMQHPCGPDSYTGTAELLSDTAFMQVARSTQRTQRSKLSASLVGADSRRARCLVF